MLWHSQYFEVYFKTVALNAYVETILAMIWGENIGWKMNNKVYVISGEGQIAFQISSNNLFWIDAYVLSLSPKFAYVRAEFWGSVHVPTWNVIV